MDEFDGPAGVGPYHFARLIGEGGMGNVYLAKKQGSDQEVAVKILHADLARHPRFVKRFHRERKVASGFDHSGLVAVLDFGTDDDSFEHYTVYEYVPGGDLAELIDQAPLDERRALEVTRGVADALSYANARAIVHRDVKPDNILLADDGTPKLTDLGLAKLLDPEVTHLTRAGTVLGTPHFMSPEQAKGVDQLDGRTDQYALGLCLWTMLTGVLPFDHDGTGRPTIVIRRRIEQELEDVRELREEISETTSQLIKHMTAREREHRYPDAGALVEDIDRLLGGGSLQGPPAPAGGESVASASAPDEGSSRAVVIALAAVFVLAVIGLAIWKLV